MTRRFRLKKDLPGVKAGRIFHEYQKLWWIDVEQVKNEPDWFEEIVEEPTKEDPIKKDPWEEGNYEEVTIKDIKVGDIVSYHKYSIFSKIRAIDTKITVAHEYDNGKTELQNYCDEATFYRQKTTQEAPQQEKKTVKMWPALFKNCDDIPSLSDQLFESETDAKNNSNNYASFQFISWPAIPNEDGSYDVPMEVE